MNNTFYFLRHGETKVDKNIPVSKWVLSETGEAQAKQESSYCIDKAISDARNNPNSGYGDAGYLNEKCRKEIAILWNAGFKANAYYDQETINEIQNFGSKIEMLLFKVELSPFRTEDYQIFFLKVLTRYCN